MDRIITYIRNLSRSKLRSTLAIIGIAIGVFSVISVISVGETGKEMIFNEIEGMGFSGLAVETEDYPMTDAQFKNVSSVTDNAMPLIVRYASGKLRNTDVNSVLIGAGENVCKVTNLTILHGRAFNSKEISAAENVCVISSESATEAYSRENICGKEIILSLGSKEVPLKIIGVSESGTGSISSIIGQTFPTFIHMPYTTLAKLCGIDGFDRISISVSQTDDADAIASSVLIKLNGEAGNKNAYTVTDIDRERDKYGKILDVITAVVSGIGGISLFVAGLMIMTLMLVSVSERGREIGIKKALGAKTVHIVTEFLTESAVISALGGALGIGLTFAASLALKLLLGVALKISAEVIVIGLALSCGTGIIFGVYPSFKAARLRPAETLRR